MQPASTPSGGGFASPQIGRLPRSAWLRRAVASASLGAAFMVACAPAQARQGSWWTVREAESIAFIRGYPLHVKSCRGLDRAQVKDGVRRHRHFACTAGTGLPTDRVDTVAVTYRLHPLGPYHGGCSRHTFTDVRFYGGPGIP
jgi:hypothetical protein